MKSKNAENYENVIIRDNKEIGINNYGLDYLIILEQENKQLKERIDKAIEIIKLCNTPCAKELLEILGGKE